MAARDVLWHLEPMLQVKLTRHLPECVEQGGA